MDGTAELLSNIQFSEAKKGYDRDQVDNFLRELGKQVGKVQDMLIDATRRAEVAEAKAAAAGKSQAEALVRAEKAESAAQAAAEAPAPPPVVNEIDAASGMLALAQKTADAAVADAEAKAKGIIADARARGAVMVVEAEQEIERIRQRAMEQVDTMVTQRSAVVDADVARLERERDALHAAVAELDGHLQQQRGRVEESIAGLRALLAEDGPLVPDPPRSGDESAGGTTVEDGKASEPVSAAVADDDADDDDSVVAADAADAMVGTATVDGVTAKAEKATDTVADTEPETSAPVLVVDGDNVAESDDEPTTPLMAATAGDAEASDVAVGAGVERAEVAAGPTIVTLEDLTARPPVAQLVEAPAALLIDLTGENDAIQAATGDATQAYDVLADPDDDESATPSTPSTAALSSVPPRVTATVDSTLGSPDADADEAMRAFFEQDAVADEHRSRFLRRK